jgi:uncharacterized protein YndB with AHSA1/START domain
METVNEPGNETTDRTIVSTRVFNSPVDELYNAWVDPSKISNWWGPKGFTNTFYVFDPSPGGKWSFIMHGPDGKNYPNESVFVSLMPNKQIILDHVVPPIFRLTATFEAQAEGTKLIFHMLFETAQVRDALSKLIVESNEENFDRLEKVLENASS